jgi:hypothetical protein
MSLFQDIQSYVSPGRAREPFIDDASAKTNVVNIFVGISLMVLAAIIALLFYISIRRDLLLFIAVFAGMMMLFGALVIGIVAQERLQYKEWSFRLMMGSSVIVTLIALGTCIVASILHVRNMRMSASSYNPPVRNYPPAVTPPMESRYDAVRDLDM